MPGQFEVMIERNFSSAHQLRGYRGKCENLHGHNYKIEIYARGRELNNIGLLVDFVELKEAADDLVTYLDHKNLNELEPFVTEQNPSAENVARFILKGWQPESMMTGYRFTRCGALRLRPAWQLTRWSETSLRCSLSPWEWAGEGLTSTANMVFLFFSDLRCAPSP